MSQVLLISAQSHGHLGGLAAPSDLISMKFETLTHFLVTPASKIVLKTLLHAKMVFVYLEFTFAGMCIIITNEGHLPQE